MKMDNLEWGSDSDKRTQGSATDRLGREDLKIVRPNSIAVQAGVAFGEVFPADCSDLRSRCHSVVMVAQFVQENVKELVSAQGCRRKVEPMPFLGALNRHSQPVEDVAMLFDIIRMRNELAQISTMRADRHKARSMKSVTVLSSRRK
jgi:hypothetical protein